MTSASFFITSNYVQASTSNREKDIYPWDMRIFFFPSCLLSICQCTTTRWKQHYCYPSKCWLRDKRWWLNGQSPLLSQALLESSCHGLFLNIYCWLSSVVSSSFSIGPLQFSW